MDPDTVYAHALGVRYVPEPKPDAQPAPVFRSEAARRLHRILDAHDWRTQRGCPNCRQNLRSAELWCLDAREQSDRFIRTRNWLIAVGAVAVAELVVIGVLSAVVLGWGG